MSDPIIASALVACVLQVWIPGPIAYELAEVAVARQRYEDGPNRPVNESVPGVGLDPVHTTLLTQIKKQFPDLHHDLVTGDAASGGTMKLYRLKGENAQVAGACFVALVLDSYPSRFSKNDEQRIWLSQRELSYRFYWPWVAWEWEAWNKNFLLRQAVIRWANKLFGPWPKGKQ